MNINKLKEAEKKFLENYPGGFSHPVIVDLVKRHKPGKMTALALKLRGPSANRHRLTSFTKDTET